MRNQTPKEEKLFARLKALKKDYIHLYRRVRFLVTLLLLMPLVFFFAYLAGDYGFGIIKTSLSIDGILAFYGGFLAFIGTVSLGCLTVWQSIRANELNNKVIQRQEELLHYNSKVENIKRIKDIIASLLCSVDIMIFDRFTLITAKEDREKLRNDISFAYNKAFLKPIELTQMFPYLNEKISEIPFNSMFGNISSELDKSIMHTMSSFYNLSKKYTKELDELRKNINKLINWEEHLRANRGVSSLNDVKNFQYTYSNLISYIDSKKITHEALVNIDYIEVMKSLNAAQLALDNELKKLEKDFIFIFPTEPQND